MTQDLTQNAQQKPKKKMSGCLIAFLIFLGIAIIGAGVIGYFTYKGINKVKDKFVNEFAEGYETHTGQNMNIPAKTGDNLYIAQSATIEGPNDGSVAFMAQNVNIEADISGDLAVTSQTLTIDKDVTIGGNVHFIGQTMLIKGNVNGEISGTAQSITIREDLGDRVKMEYGSMHNIPNLQKRKLQADTLSEKADSISEETDTTIEANPDDMEDSQTE